MKEFEFQSKINNTYTSALTNTESAISNLRRGYNVKDAGLIGDGIVNDYTVLSGLLTTISTSPMDLYFPSGTYKISSNLVIGSNIRLIMENGAMFSVDSGITLTINGEIEAGLYQVFGGLGTVGGTPKCDAIYPEWFGAIADWNGTTGTDNTTYINNCFVFATGKRVVFSNLSYKVVSSLSPKSNTIIEWNNTTIFCPSRSDRMGLFSLATVSGIRMYGSLFVDSLAEHTWTTTLGSLITTSNIFVFWCSSQDLYIEELVCRNLLGVAWISGTATPTTSNNIVIDRIITENVPAPLFAKSVWGITIGSLHSVIDGTEPKTAHPIYINGNVKDLTIGKAILDYSNAIGDLSWMVHLYPLVDTINENITIDEIISIGAGNPFVCYDGKNILVNNLVANISDPTNFTIAVHNESDVIINNVNITGQTSVFLYMHGSSLKMPSCKINGGIVNCLIKDYVVNPGFAKRAKISNVDFNGIDSGGSNFIMSTSKGNELVEFDSCRFKFVKALTNYVINLYDTVGKMIFRDCVFNNTINTIAYMISTSSGNIAEFYNCKMINFTGLVKSTNAGLIKASNIIYEDSTIFVPIQTITATTTLNSTYNTVLCNNTSNIVINLPTCISSPDKLFVIKKINSAVATITITANGAETIDGISTKVISTQYDTVKIMNDGVSWFIV